MRCTSRSQKHFAAIHKSCNFDCVSRKAGFKLYVFDFVRCKVPAAFQDDKEITQMIKKATSDREVGRFFFVPKQFKWDMEGAPRALTNGLEYGNVPNELKCSRNNMLACFDNKSTFGGEPKCLDDRKSRNHPISPRKHSEN
jgi:hypothetical protein